MKRRSHYPRVRPAVDVMDAADGLWILANMPGVRTEDLHLVMEGDLLHIHGSSHCPRPATGGRDLRTLEFGNVEFELDILMDAPLSAPPTASLNQGVLSVFLPGETQRDVRLM